MKLSLLPAAMPSAWFNAAQWVPQEAGFQPWRVTPELVATARNPHFTHRASASAGVRAEVKTDANALRIALAPCEPDEEERLTVDVVFDGRLHDRFTLERNAHGTPTTTTVSLPGGPGRLEVWLPHEGSVVLNELSLTGATYCQAVPSRKKWLTYGSSITHCIEADGPSQTWPALVARKLDFELYALGMAGQCHLDYAIEQTIAGSDVDAISLCLGINIYGRGSFDERSLPGALHGFIARARAAHPTVPVVVMSPLISPPAEEEPNVVGLTLAQVREIVREVAQGFNAEAVTYIDGREIIGAAQAEAQLLADELHPHSAGYGFMADRLTPHLAAAFDVPSAQSPLEVAT